MPDGFDNSGPFGFAAPPGNSSSARGEYMLDAPGESIWFSKASSYIGESNVNEVGQADDAPYCVGRIQDVVTESVASPYASSTTTQAASVQHGSEPHDGAGIYKLCGTSPAFITPESEVGPWSQWTSLLTAHTSGHAQSSQSVGQQPGNRGDMRGAENYPDGKLAETAADLFQSTPIAMTSAQHATMQAENIFGSWPAQNVEFGSMSEGASRVVAPHSIHNAGASQRGKESGDTCSVEAGSEWGYGSLHQWAAQSAASSAQGMTTAQYGDGRSAHYDSDVGAYVGTDAYRWVHDVKSAPLPSQPMPPQGNTSIGAVRAADVADYLLGCGLAYPSRLGAVCTSASVGRTPGAAFGHVLPPCPEMEVQAFQQVGVDYKEPDRACHGQHPCETAVSLEEQPLNYSEDWNAVGAEQRKEYAKTSQQLTASVRFKHPQMEHTETQQAQFFNCTHHSANAPSRRGFENPPAGVKTEKEKKSVGLNVVLAGLLNNDFESASASLQAAGRLTRYHFNTLINDCIKAARPEAAMWCVDEMARLGVVPNIVSFNAVLHGCAKAGNFKLAAQWWERLPSLNLTANKVTYNTMINACAQARRPAEAEATLEEMIALGISPCKVSFTTIIVGFANLGDAVRAEKWLMRMREMGLEGDVVSYNSLLNACAKAGDLQTARRWANQMVTDGLTPDITTYNSLIHACAKLGQNRAAAAIYCEMKASGLQPDLVTMGSLIDANAKVGNPVEAEHWMNTAYAEGITPNEVCFNCLLNACVLACDLARAEAWFETMIRSQCQPTSVTYNFMISTYVQKGDEQGISRMLDDMIGKNLHPDQVTVRTIHRALRNLKGRRKEVSIRQLYCAVIRMYLQRGCTTRAVQWLRDMSKSSTKPSTDFLAEVMSSLQAAQPTVSVERLAL